MVKNKRIQHKPNLAREPQKERNIFFNYLMNFITFIGGQQSQQPNFTAFPSQTLSASPTPQPISFGNHKFFKGKK